MAVEVKVPSVGESITTGAIAQWHVEDGGQVKRGDVLFTLETDKISTEIEAEESGRIEILAEEGSEVPIGAVVARIASDVGAPEVSITDAPKSGKSGKSAKASEDGGEEATPTEGSPLALGEKIARVSQAAEKAAAMMLAGKGAKGPSSSDKKKKKKKKDPAPPAVLEPASQPLPEPRAIEGDRTSRSRMTPLRRKIATHLVAAQQEAAILTTFNECDMSAMMTVRRQVQEAFTAKHGVKLGFMSFFIKAVVRALAAVPQINARIDGDDIVTNHYYDIGVAIGTERGLVVPVVRDCDTKSLAEIEHDIAEYAARARAGKLQLEDLQGGVFTISNGGIYGSMLSTPILNPPQCGILGMHTIMDRPIAIDGKAVVRPMMYLALSYDHRIVDGKEAVTFLIEVKLSIEEPARLMV